jgi:uncharacterized membrane protein YfcA
VTLLQLVLIGLTLFWASVLQGAVGFAFSLFATPLLVWAGLSLSEVVAIVSLSIFVQVFAATLQLHRQVRWRIAFSAAAIRILAIPVGIALLLVIDSLGRVQARQILGFVLLAILLTQLLWKVSPQERLHSGWAVLAFTSSGVMQGVAAMGGPPVVLWVLAHRWTSLQTRAFPLALMLLTSPFQLTLLFISTPQDLTSTFLTGLAFAPVVVLGTATGVWLGNLIEKELLRKLALSALFITAVVSIAAPLFS